MKTMKHFLPLFIIAGIALIFVMLVCDHAVTQYITCYNTQYIFLAVLGGTKLILFKVPTVAIYLLLIFLVYSFQANPSSIIILKEVVILAFVINPPLFSICSYFIGLFFV